MVVGIFGCRGNVPKIKCDSRNNGRRRRRRRRRQVHYFSASLRSERQRCCDKFGKCIYCMREWAHVEHINEYMFECSNPMYTPLKTYSQHLSFNTHVTSKPADGTASDSDDSIASCAITANMHHVDDRNIFIWRTQATMSSLFVGFCCSAAAAAAARRTKKRKCGMCCRLCETCCVYICCVLLAASSLPVAMRSPTVCVNYASNSERAR